MYGRNNRLRFIFGMRRVSKDFDISKFVTDEKSGHLKGGIAQVNPRLQGIFDRKSVAHEN